MSKIQIPVLLLTGYLGSGKTTLLNRILNNEKGYRFAVIVNDLGEVNIDADLVQKGGVVGQGDGSDNNDLVALSNGCICCSLQTDLVKQLSDLSQAGKFDYIVIEASGICDPAPIAQTIAMMPRMDPAYTAKGVPVLDSIVTVVDALRLSEEFGHGQDLLDIRDADEEEKEGNLTALVVDQIEFCNVVLLNKISLLQPHEARHLRDIVHAIQPKARIIECDFCDVPFDEILGTGAFDFEETAKSAAWVEGVEGENATYVVNDHEHHHHHDEDEDEHEHHHDDDEHEHHHHHDDDEHEHHHHDEDEHEHDHGHHHHHDHHHHEHGDHDHAAEYGITTFVYYRRKPFDLNKFDWFVGSHWPKGIIRSKGVLYFSNNRDMSYLFETAGTQKNLTQAGYWCATAPENELKQMMENDPLLRRDWDPEYGDRLIKLVFIGQNLNADAIIAQLDDCLAE